MLRQNDSMQGGDSVSDPRHNLPIRTYVRTSYDEELS